MRRALEVWILVMVSRNVLRSIDSRVTQEEELDQWAMAGRPRISCHLGDVAEEGREDIRGGREDVIIIIAVIMKRTKSDIPIDSTREADVSDRERE